MLITYEKLSKEAMLIDFITENDSKKIADVCTSVTKNQTLNSSTLEIEKAAKENIQSVWGLRSGIQLYYQ